MATPNREKPKEEEEEEADMLPVKVFISLFDSSDSQTL